MHFFLIPFFNRYSPLIPVFLIPVLLLGCGQQQTLETCQMSAITNIVGDTILTLEYEDSLLVRIDRRNPTRVSRFTYENGFLIREEQFTALGVLQSFGNYAYNSDSLHVETTLYVLTPDGEWRPDRVERFSEFEGRFPTISRMYQVNNGREILTSYHQYTWENGALIQDLRWEQIPSTPSALRVAEKTVYIYDSRPSPWPDIPAISPWLRTRVYASITKTLISYLPDGTTQETVFAQAADNRFSRDGVLQESVVTSFTGETESRLFQYLCEDLLP